MTSTSKKVLIWGAGGHALVVSDILRLLGDYEIAGYIDSMKPTRQGEQFNGSVVLGGVEQIRAAYDAGVRSMMIAIGDCRARLENSQYAASLGFELVTAIHPASVVASGVRIGPGSMVAAGAVVNPGCRIGNNVIVNTCASVDHECYVGDGAHISPGAHLAGRVHVGRVTQIGIGSAVIENIRIGDNVIIGAGSAVVRDIPDNVVAFGVPARVVSTRENWRMTSIDGS